MKITNLCTSDVPYNTLINKPNGNDLISIYKMLAKETGSKRFTTKAIIQLIDAGRFALNHKLAVLNAFRIPTSKLTKKERKTAKICYDIAQTDLARSIITTLLYQPQFSNNLKLLSQMKEYINEDNTNNNSTPTSLNINLTNKKAKITNTNTKDTTLTPKDTTPTNTDTQTKDISTPNKPLPLKLVNI